jgi:predicted alpha/beta-fold hydrolase
MTERFDFAAPRLLRNRHVQTLGAALPLWIGTDLSFEAMRIPIPGGGALHAKASWHPGDATAVILIHGVGGSSDSSYVRRAALGLYRSGFHVVRLDLRGAGDSIPDAPLLYHAGLIEDPAIALEAVAAKRGVTSVGLLGFSLGGNVSLKLAAAWGARVPGYVRAVASVSAPLDLVEASRSLERLRALPYRGYVLRKLLQQGREFARVHPSRATYDPSRLRKLRTIRAYDEEVIAPMHGFCDAHDYYVHAAAGPGLADVRVPTLIVHAADDPMIPEVSVRRWLRDASPAVRVAWSARGGHVGWFSGVREDAWVHTWAMERVVSFFAG